MKRYKKEELLRIAELLAEANDCLGICAEANLKGVLEVLAACQETAVLLGNYIEESKKDNAGLVGILEDYCEAVYQMSVHLSDEKERKKLFTKIRKQLVQLQNGISYDMEDKKEVVFLPYKASMWDSLESVWKEADADEGTDAYVIPIPYYDKNQDGSFREMHYEGELYPEYVPVTPYGAYDFAERRPDVIYIHNPYDEMNYVTSVEPFFYSKNLKKYTDKLVYIPYFVLAEINPKDRDAVDGMAHFVTVPGVIHADRVVVQSEDMRQIYIDVMSKETGEEKRKYWEEKILGTGSPKFDKVINTKINDKDIPEDWKKFIYRPDGSKRKIVLYNTSVSALLQYTRNYIEKMHSVFDIFKDYRDDVVLLWRPHPLVQATIASMRPTLWNEYWKVIAEYRNAGWGIYDDSPELERAIGMADAYYGDQSSVVQLCQKIEIPILIQTMI